MKVVTHYWAKPIPDRRFDWEAWDDDTYDGSPDSHCPIGRGPTRREAIRDLLEQIRDRIDARQLNKVG